MVKARKPEKIVILVPEGSVIAECVIGAIHLFKIAIQNVQAHSELANKDMVITAARTRKVKLFYGALDLRADLLFEEVKDPTLIIVPPFNFDPEDSVPKNKLMVEWLKEQYRKKVTIASLCTGAYYLAEAGILKNKNCTMHWLYQDDFMQKYSDVMMQKDSVITENEGVYCSGGGYSYLNLILYLIERMYGRKISHMISCFFEIDALRRSQSQFVLFESQYKHENIAVSKMQKHIEENYSENITLQTLSKISNLSERTVVRQFKFATGNTPLAFQQRVRIEVGKELLEKSDKRIKEILYEVGYSDMKTFRDLFHKFTGLNPIQYRKKYQERVS